MQTSFNKSTKIEKVNLHLQTNYLPLGLSIKKNCKIIFEILTSIETSSFPNQVL